MFACSLFLYHVLGASWMAFLALCLWPDLFMLGYLVNARVGARLYNLVHTETLPIALAGASVGFRQSGLMAFSLIWLAHIGVDRALGYGLKYPTTFKDTHLQRVRDEARTGRSDYATSSSGPASAPPLSNWAPRG
jgi:hypothetical protein